MCYRCGNPQSLGVVRQWFGSGSADTKTDELDEVDEVD